MELKKYYTKKKVKELGFSDRLIDALLPKPLLEKNPHHKDAKPMKLWEKETVRKAMKAKDFKDYQVERQHRSMALKNASEIKRLETKQTIINELKNLKIKVVDEEQIRTDTLKFHQFLGQGDFFINASEIKQKKKMINTIRHQYTNYNKILHTLKGKIGSTNAYRFLKEELLKLIARYYPFLEEEACSQIIALRNLSDDKLKPKKRWRIGKK